MKFNNIKPKMSFKKIRHENDIKAKVFVFFKKNGDFVTFGLWGHVTFWLAISPPLNILRPLTHEKIGNWISFRNMCIVHINYIMKCLLRYLHS